MTSWFRPAAGWMTRQAATEFEPLEVFEQDGVGRVHEDVHQVGRDQRDREHQDLARRDPHLRLAQAPERPPPSEDLPQDDHIQGYPKGPGGDIARRQEEHTCIRHDQEDHDRQAQARGQDVLAEEDRTGAGEHGQKAGQQLVVSLDRGEQDEDEQERRGVRRVRQGPEGEILEQVDPDDQKRAQGQDQTADPDDRAEQAIVVLLLVIDGQEARRAAIQA